MSSPKGVDGSWRQITTLQCSLKPCLQNCWARIACKANIFFTCLQVYDTLNRHGPWPIWCLLERRGGKKSKSVWEHLIHCPLCQACKNKHLKCRLVLQFGCWGNALVNGAFVEMTSSACRKNRDCRDRDRGVAIAWGTNNARDPMSSRETFLCNACCVSTPTEALSYFRGWAS